MEAYQGRDMCNVYYASHTWTTMSKSLGDCQAETEGVEREKERWWGVSKTFSEKIEDIIMSACDRQIQIERGSNPNGYMSIDEARKAIMDAVRELVPNDANIVSTEFENGFSWCRKQILQRLEEQLN